MCFLCGILQEVDLSPCSPTSPPKSQAEAELLERKTTVMRLQNRRRCSVYQRCLAQFL